MAILKLSSTRSSQEEKLQTLIGRIVVVLCVILSGISSRSLCQSLSKMLSVHSSSMTAHTRFGWRVAINNNWAVISSPFEEVNGHIAAGSIYLYSAEQGWNQVQHIEAPVAQAIQTFGMSVALTDNVLVVGAPGDHEGALMSGAVFIYTRGNFAWTFSEKIVNPDPVMGGRFGTAVDISPRVLVISAIRDFGSAEKSGLVYVFEKDTTSWRLAKKLYPKVVISDEAFGTSVRLIDDSTVAVARSMSDPLEGRKEAVSIFSRRGNTWSQTDLTIPSDGGSDLFGNALSSNDKYIAVGIPGRTIAGVRCGGVIIYERSTLLPLWTVNNPKTSELIYFGGSVFLKNNRLYVGCVQTESEERVPMGKVAGYDIGAFNSGPAQWYLLEDLEYLPHACPQVSATDSIVLASSPFCDVDGVVDAGTARFFPISGTLNVEEPSIPLEYALSQNYPNPFNSTTRINYSVKAPGKVKMEMFNILGQLVAMPVNEEKKGGKYFVSFDARRFASGVYFYRLSVNEFVERKKMVLLK
jgi:hypothetical protein